MITEQQAMARALQLARRGWYGTSPNPRVGCVLLRDGEIIGEGWHAKAGEGHAEVKALEAAGNARGATAYVTLEPCSHQGKTPPCADALIAAGVSRVVAAMLDPNPAVAGRGIAKLQAAGIEVASGLMADAAEQLNAGFFKRMRTGLPRVTVKLAMSVDGRTAMASGESQWITGAEARRDVQKLRAQSCAIVSGADTLLADNAAFTVRESAFQDSDEIIWRQPLRVIIDSGERVGIEGAFFESGGPRLLVGVQPRQHGNAECVALPADAGGKVDLTALLENLAERQCNEVLVEAGPSLAGAFVQQGLVDELIVYMAPVLMGSCARPLLDLPLGQMAEKKALNIREVRAIGDDWRLSMVPAAATVEN